MEEDKLYFFECLNGIINYHAWFIYLNCMVLFSLLLFAMSVKSNAFLWSFYLEGHVAPSSEFRECHHNYFINSHKCFEEGINHLGFCAIALQ